MKDLVKRVSWKYLIPSVVLLILAAPLTVGAVDCVAPPSGMVSWWGGDNNALDMVGTSNGTLVNGATYAAGKVGQAFSLNGNYVEVPHADALVLNDGLTLEAWFKLSAARQSAIFFKGDANGVDTQSSYGLMIEADGSIAPILFGNYPADIHWTAAGLVVPDQWYHIAQTWDGKLDQTNNVLLYLNGSLVQTWTKSGVPLNATTQSLSLGSMKAPTYYGNMNGLIDEPAIFNRALSADEIAAIYNAGSAGKCRSCTGPPSSMISWWTGDDNAQDIQGANHGTLMNNASFADGKVGRAFSLDGVDDYVTVPYSASLDVSGTITIDAWIYRNDATAEAGLLEKGAPGTNGVYELAIFDHKFYFRLNGAGLNMPSVTSLPVGTWTHVAGTYDGTTAKIYINGLLDATQAYSAPIGTDNNPLYIGLYGTAAKHFPGLIDELEIFNRALDASEIAAIYNAGSAGKCKPQCTPPPSGMVSWWGGDNNALDMVGTNEGTIQGGAIYAAGKVGQTFSFDGLDDFVSVPYASSLDFTGGDFSIDAWVYPVTVDNAGEGIAGRLPFSNGSGWGFAIQGSGYGNEGKLNFFGNDWVGPSVGTVATNAWTHVAVTRSGNTLTYYINGSPSGSFTNANSTGSFNNGLALVIGDMYPSWAESVWRFSGNIDEVEIFNRALTAQEISAIYDAGSAGKCRSCTPPAADMISWWRADGNADDIIGGNDGTLQGGAAYGAGKVGQAFSFDGVDSTVQAQSALTGSTSFSISSWIKIHSFTHQYYMAPFSQNLSAVNYFTWVTGELEFGFVGRWADETAFDLRTLSPPFGIGVWKHLTVTYDGATMKQYVDGSLHNAQDYAGKTLGNNEPFMIGKGAAYPGGILASIYFDGLVDELSVYSRALSAEEIAAIYNAGSAGQCAYTIGTNTPTNGTIVCDALVPQGGDAECTITPDTGYYLSALTDNGGDVLGSVVAGTYTIANVTATHDVVATFARYPVWRDGTTGYFMTVVDAYGDGTTAYTIKAHGVELTDSNLNLAGTATVVIDGGYLADFGGYSGTPTTITGPLTISGSGSVTISNVAVK